MAKFIVEGVGEFEWDPTSFTLRDAIEMEKATGARISELVLDYNGYNDPSGQGLRGALGRAALLWHAMRINGHITPFARMVEEIRIDAVTEIWDAVETPEKPEEPPDPPAEPPVKTQSSGSAQKKASSTTK